MKENKYLAQILIGKFEAHCMYMKNSMYYKTYTLWHVNELLALYKCFMDMGYKAYNQPTIDLFKGLHDYDIAWHKYDQEIEELQRNKSMWFPDSKLPDIQTVYDLLKDFVPFQTEVQRIELC